MTIEEICKIRTDIDMVVYAHEEELRDTFESARKECGDLGDADEIKKQYDAIVVPGRQLHIGIVGRVKAGKSSLLNSLFFGGKNVLPKAATPMTAALTKLYYSEKPTVRINFFDAGDKAKIEEKAKRYEKLFESSVKNKLNEKREKANQKKEQFDEDEQRKKCERIVRVELAENNVILVGAAEQWELLKNASPSVLEMLGKSEEKELSRIEDIAKELANYVGANGKYTPITRDVELGFPFETLKDITVVDTPGFDDPVPSRDAAARESLKKCDAIFVLSPAGQFCNEEDRVNIEKIENGEGIQNICVIASKIDAELGNESKDESAGDIQTELQLIVNNISQTLRKLIDGFPRDGMLYKKLSEDLNRGLLYTSGICQSMHETWENQAEWDSDETDTWERLAENYPDYFSSKDESARETLKVIGNIEKIRDRITEVRDKKDEILGERKNKFLAAKGDMVKKVASVLDEEFEEKMEIFENTDIAALKKEQEKQNENFLSLKTDFEDVLKDSFDKYYMDCREACIKIVNDFYAGVKGTSGNALGTETNSYTVTVKNPGLGAKIARFFKLGGTHEESRTETHTVLNASEVREAIRDFAENMAEVIQVEMDKRRSLFKGSLKSDILKIWGKYQMSEFIGEKYRAIQAGNIVSAIPDCQILIDWSLPANLRSGGRLLDDDAEEYMDAASDEMRKIKAEYNDSIKDFLSTIKSKLDASKTAEMILSKMKGNLDKMMKDLSQREATLDNYRHIRTEIKDLVKNFNR